MVVVRDGLVATYGPGDSEAVDGAACAVAVDGIGPEGLGRGAADIMVEAKRLRHNNIVLRHQREVALSAADLAAWEASGLASASEKRGQRIERIERRPAALSSRKEWAAEERAALDASAARVLSLPRSLVTVYVVLSGIRVASARKVRVPFAMPRAAAPAVREAIPAPLLVNREAPDAPVLTAKQVEAVEAESIRLAAAAMNLSGLPDIKDTVPAGDASGLDTAAPLKGEESERRAVLTTVENVARRYRRPAARRDDAPVAPPAPAPLADNAAEIRALLRLETPGSKEYGRLLARLRAAR